MAAVMDAAYKVKLDVFEGPLDLLLYLVRKDEVDIYDIEIGRITKQYLEYLGAMESINVEIAGEFIVMAANLLYIKSRTLLPVDQQGPAEEEGEEEDPRWELIRQLIEYKKFKEAARKLGEKEAKQQNLFSHKPDKIVAADDAERPLDDGLGIFDLIRAFQNILDRLNDEGLGEIVDDQYTVGDKIDHLLGLIPPGGSMPFAALFKGATTKHEMIVTFLAVLELMKLNFFRVRQERVLGEIELHRNEF